MTSYNHINFSSIDDDQKQNKKQLLNESIHDKLIRILLFIIIIIIFVYMFNYSVELNEKIKFIIIVSIVYLFMNIYYPNIIIKQ
jgi:ABC-type xylose transport system permease subunit